MQIEEVINRFKSSNGFVENIDLVVNYLKSNHFTIRDINEILKQIIKYNREFNEKIKQENEELKKMINNRRHFIDAEPEVNVQPKEVVYYGLPEDSELDISYYKIQIDNCANLDELESLLPKKTVENFDELINAILLYLLQEEMDYRRMILENSETLESYPEISNYVTEIGRKFEIVKNYRDHKEVNKDAVNNKQNDLIFLTTEYGNPCGLSDIKDIDSEYYGSFLDLLNSIINGTFKNVKSFSIQGSGTVISEVKDFKTRILFIKLQPSIYLITSIFVKKSDNDLFYRNHLIGRDNLYRSKIAKIKELLSSPDREAFLQENESIKEEVLALLKSGIKVKR